MSSSKLTIVWQTEISTSRQFGLFLKERFPVCQLTECLQQRVGEGQYFITPGGTAAKHCDVENQSNHFWKWFLSSVFRLPALRSSFTSSAILPALRTGLVWLPWRLVSFHLDRNLSRSDVFIDMVAFWKKKIKTKWPKRKKYEKNI